MRFFFRPDTDLTGLAVDSGHQVPLADVVDREQHRQPHSGAHIRPYLDGLCLQGFADPRRVGLRRLCGHPALQGLVCDVGDLDPLSRRVGEVEFRQTLQVKGLHAVQQQVVQLLRAVYEFVVEKPLAGKDSAAVHTGDLHMHRPPHQLVGEIEAPQVFDERREVFGLRPGPVRAAPVREALLCLLLRQGKGDDALRQAVGVQVIAPHQASAAEGAGGLGLPLLKDDRGAAAGAGGLHQAEFLYLLLQPLALDFAEALLFPAGLPDFHASPAVSAEIPLLHDVEVRRAAAGRAVDIRDAKPPRTLDFCSSGTVCFHGSPPWDSP